MKCLLSISTPYWLWHTAFANYKIQQFKYLDAETQKDKQTKNKNKPHDVFNKYMLPKAKLDT